MSLNKNWMLRVAALEAIAKREDPSLLPSIGQELQDPRREVRYTAAAAMIHLSDVANVRARAKTANAPRPMTSTLGVALADIKR